MSTISSSYDYTELLNSVYTAASTSASSGSSSSSSSDSYSGTSVSSMLSTSSTSSLSTEVISYLSNIKDSAVSLQSAYSSLSKVDTTDTDSMVSSMKSFVEAYNSMMSSAKDSDNSGARKLVNQLKVISETYGSALEDIGVTAESDGTLSIDDSKLSAAASDGSLSRFLETNASKNGSYGFVNRVNLMASKVSNNPTDYYTEAAASKKSADSLTFSDFNKTQISQIIKYDTTGMLFDLLA